jgi:hypothetical protein
VVILIAFLLGGLASYFYFQKAQPELGPKDNVYLAFLSEIYDKIKENYWEDLTDLQLCNLFKSATETLLARPQPELWPQNKEGLLKMLAETIDDLPQQKRKEFSVKLANLVLINLKPLERNQLYTQKDEKALKNRVQNINPEVDLYQTLEVSKEASPKEIEEAYQKKLAKLKSQPDLPEIKQKIKEVEYAHRVLSSPEKKEKYDRFGIEPTVFSKVIDPNIFHIYIKKFSPTTLEEFERAAESVDNLKDLDTLILDLRDNVGGSIDLLPYILGPFIGQNQYAYELYHQQNYQPFKTKTGWLPSLVKYKKVVILVNEKTQSTAELMAATLKKYNVGVLVGLPTRGWGTVEKVFQIEQQIDPAETYSVFLVHSLTLREDGQPIEGRGVEPVININDPDWEKQLLSYFHYPELIQAIKEIWEKDPQDFY